MSFMRLFLAIVLALMVSMFLMGAAEVTWRYVWENQISFEKLARWIALLAVALALTPYFERLLGDGRDKQTESGPVEPSDEGSTGKL